MNVRAHHRRPWVGLQADMPRHRRPPWGGRPADLAGRETGGGLKADPQRRLR
jgi:hypothetical protein